MFKRTNVLLNICSVLGGMMAGSSTLNLTVEVLDEGVYSVLYNDWVPLPLVILVGSNKMSYVWPQKEVVLRFRFAS